MDDTILNENDVPEGWVRTSVGEVLTFNYGKGLKKSKRRGGNVSVYGSNGEVGKHDEAITKGTTIIIGRKGSLGAVNYSEEPCWPIDTTYFIDDFKGLDPLFVYRLLASLELTELDTSSAIPGLNRDVAYEQEFLLPPLPEQQRIVAKVEELLARVNAARERLEKVPAMMKRFRQAVLAAACSGRLTADWREKEGGVREYKVDSRLPGYFEGVGIPANWDWVKLGDLARTVQYGVSVKGSKDENTGVRILRMGNIQEGEITLDEMQYVPKDKFDFNRFVLNVGDVLFNRTNSPELVGKTAVFKERVEVVFASYIIRVILNPDTALSDYVCWWANSLWGKRWAEAVKTDGVSQSNINATKLKALLIPLPPIGEQREIVRRVEGLFALADKVEERVARARAATDKLEQAVLAKAFRGGLVPTEAELARRERREYEPAAALLERVRGEKEKTEGPAKKKRRKHRRSRNGSGE